jgi:hypothetical protein
LEIIGYGEDGLTLWAIERKLGHILKQLKDPSDLNECRTFYRPSFGRRGGPGSSQFGEFDFFLLSRDHLYLGESKWKQSSEEIAEGVITLRGEQVVRNLVFRAYVEEWFDKGDWAGVPSKLKMLTPPIDKKVPSPKSLLAGNLKSILMIIKTHFGNKTPIIHDVLLYFFHSKEMQKRPIPNKVQVLKGNKIDFKVVALDYSEAIIEDTRYFIL